MFEPTGNNLRGPSRDDWRHTAVGLGVFGLVGLLISPLLSLSTCAILAVVGVAAFIGTMKCK